MKNQLLATTLGCCLLGAACETKVVQEKKYGPDGTVVSSTYSENGKVLNDLKRVLEKETVRGRGKFKHPSESMARIAALNLALDDLAGKAGEIVATRDVTLYNDKINALIRTEGRNIVKGYDVVFENWDEAKTEYEILIEMRGYKVAEEISKRVQ